jgi:mannose-1-phosphate guanylyltransferase
MQALILAGGEGTRLRPLTTTVPKPVVPLANRPFISYMIDWLAGHGFQDIVMSCGFLAEGVRAVLGSGKVDGIRIRYVEEPEPLGTAGPVKLAEPLLDERFAVLNGDILTDFDLSRVLDFHVERRSRATLTLVAVDDPSSYGLVLTDAQDRVTDFIEKPEGEAPTNLINAGMYVLERDVVETIPDDRAVSFEREVFPGLVGRGLHGLALDGYWLDIGTPERYLQATRDILDGTLTTSVHTALGPDGVRFGQGTNVDRGASVSRPVLAGSSCEIAEGAEVGPGVTLGDRCRIERGATLREAALHDEVVVEQDAFVVDSIVAGRVRLGKGCRLEGETIVGEGAAIEPHTALAGARIDADAAQTRISRASR